MRSAEHLGLLIYRSNLGSPTRSPHRPLALIRLQHRTSRSRLHNCWTRMGMKMHCGFGIGYEGKVGMYQDGRTVSRTLQRRHVSMSPADYD